MSDWRSIQERYLRDAVPVRLGGLAANLARIRSFSDRAEHGDVVARMVRESALFIEWTARDLAGTEAPELVELQRCLFRWYRDWGAIWDNEERRALVAREAAEWSRRVLEMSGLASREA